MFKLLEGSFFKMKAETIERNPSPENIEKERTLIIKSGIPFILRRILKDENIKPKDETLEKAGKYLRDISWGYNKSGNFCKNVTISTRGREIIVSGKEELIFASQDLSDVTKLRKGLKKVVKKPALRSESEFTLS